MCFYENWDNIYKAKVAICQVKFFNKNLKKNDIPEKSDGLLLSLGHGHARFSFLPAPHRQIFL